VTPLKGLLAYHLEGCSERGLDRQTKTALFLQHSRSEQRSWQQRLESLSLTIYMCRKLTYIH
jgi:hypothetical protein